LMDPRCLAALGAVRNGHSLPVRHVDERGVMFSVIHAEGSGDDDPPLGSLSELYDELLSAADEDPDVTLRRVAEQNAS
jgi:hypothetical protein